MTSLLLHMLMVLLLIVASTLAASLSSLYIIKEQSRVRKPLKVKSKEEGKRLDNSLTNAFFVNLTDRF